MITLGIDTSNQALAVGVVEDKQVLGQIQLNVKQNHSIALMPAIDTLVKSLGLTPKAIQRIVVAEGPGSYTGLRIGVTVAKTLVYTLNQELVGVSSLQALAANCVSREGWIIPLFDARRENVYAGIYQWQAGELVNQLADQHIALTDLLTKIPEGQKVYFVGSDVAKFQEKIKAGLPHAEINQEPHWDLPSGAVVALLGENAQPVADVHSFLPKYLKRVEAEEKWLATNQEEDQNYVEKI
ncbi:tRNA threonylcarbamoyladenosine biosynthesis protein TsaB [Enterococcus sp. PF1-24]|uniref:tRNA (adenosine(37)-N6)-threonylcarbamoyltransferase complex dimerization subunit type 1 TsaB n=1 Tax=unclassified Enterococcus TaxID=2608891 RepID=UPI00247451DF|nr:MULTISPECIES: tRNA (adenosine(37)-N6)-threonylcarbamoyltransferase complex dimerization subunit type 1 TsaB [unclassified Enterococcus]MDH6364969.1 tRNA threonylcarbamoyladenosine biosynthesis protein TsaB [Enterococcus sp. PFB1-1]MDH6402070.1 tRNA threonylcarbamoyladenosine biosynthesis protein TsaB [Enterococcus sp. PF1-24]